MTNIPDITNIWKCKSYDELSKIVNDWLMGDEAGETDGTEKFNKTETTEKTLDTKKTYNNLDDAFSDLMS
jgi:hypothetical protein